MTPNSSAIEVDGSLVRNADFQSAVSPIFNRAGSRMLAGLISRIKFAIQQIEKSALLFWKLSVTSEHELNFVLSSTSAL